MWPSRIGTYPPTNSAVCLRMLPPECSRERRGTNGMNNLECRYRLCLGASFLMAHLVPSLAISLVDDCDVQLGNPDVVGSKSLARCATRTVILSKSDRASQTSGTVTPEVADATNRRD